MIIVKDESTRDEALTFCANTGKVHYSDHYQYRTVSSPITLAHMLTEALERGEIAIVAAPEESMTAYSAALATVKAERRAEHAATEEAARKYIREHPEEIKAMVKKLNL